MDISESRIRGALRVACLLGGAQLVDPETLKLEKLEELLDILIEGLKDEAVV